MPPPHSRQIKREWRINTKVPTEIGGCLQRSASAPAEGGGGGGSRSSNDCVEVNWRSWANNSVDGKKRYRSRKRCDRVRFGVRVTSQHKPAQFGLG
ncbi:hypothetical protein ACHAPA_001772 [Fusarium lateritium]